MANKPPYTITEKAADSLAKIVEAVTRLEYDSAFNQDISLHRENRVRTVHASLAIEGNSLTVGDVAAVIQGKAVAAKQAEIKEVKNAYEAYDQVITFDPYCIKDFLKAHQLMTGGLLEESGIFRSGDAGVFDGDMAIHVGARPRFVPRLMEELFAWVKESQLHPVLKGAVVHYEIEIIHPFADGNGRMGRLWQTLLLSKWNAIFAWIPMEALVYANRQRYYDTLNESQRRNDSGSFIEFTLETILDAITAQEKKTMTKCLQDIETPALLVDLTALERNIRVMADAFSGTRTALRPHYKTHKCPEIAKMQMAAGAKGMTCAKLTEAETLTEAGIKDILIANQIIDPQKITRLARMAHKTRVTVCADNAQNIHCLSKAAQAAGTQLRVLVELEVGMRRCGVDTREEALTLARQIINAEGLVFEGLQAYTGNLSHVCNREERAAGVRAATEKIMDTAAFLRTNGVAVKQISGSGTGTYDMPDGDAVFTEVQAGSYVFMDSDYAKLGLPFVQSLFVLTTVISKRPGIAVTDAGTKVCCRQMGPPYLAGYPGMTVTLNEEHGKIADEQDVLRFGQTLLYVPSHCCSTVNLHDRFTVVQDGIRVGEWPITGRGMSR